MKVRTLLFCAVVLAIALPTFAADTPMKPGKWQVTIETDMPNMPFKMPAFTTTTCITEEQAAKPEPPKAKKNDDCKVSDYKLDGNTVTWKMACEKQQMSGTGRITYSAESYEGVMKMQMGETEMTQKYKGKLLGACDK